jgi:flagellin-like hook-associated protein FlgL
MTGITSTQGAISAANDGIAAIKSLLTAAQGIANLALQSAQALVTVTGTNSTAFTTASTIASAGGSSSRLKAGDTVTVSDGTTTATYTAANGDTIQTLLNAVNNTAGLNVTAALNTSGQLQFTATSNVDVTIGGTLAGAGGGTLTSILGLTADTTNYTTNTTRSQLATQFNDLLGQIDQAAADAGFDGVNLLTGGSSTVMLNEDGTASLTVTGSTATSSALGASAAGNNFQLTSDINTALTNIGSALKSIQAISTTVGSMATVLQTRVDFNKAMMDTLNSGADALTANDANADSAMLLALQTRQQIALTSLSLTRGEDASALRLFGL